MLYPFYEAAPRLFDLTPLADQRLGGVIMWVPSGLIPLAAFTIVFFRWVAAEADESRVSARTTRCVAPGLAPPLRRPTPVESEGRRHARLSKNATVKVQFVPVGRHRREWMWKARDEESNTISISGQRFESLTTPCGTRARRSLGDDDDDDGPAAA